MATINFEKNKYQVPISAEMHALITSCGYNPTELLRWKASYRKDIHRIIFQNGYVAYDIYYDDWEEDRAPTWVTRFQLEYNILIPELAIVELLQQSGAIDYRKLPEHKEMVNDIVNTFITKKNGYTISVYSR